MSAVTQTTGPGTISASPASLPLPGKRPTDPRSLLRQSSQFLAVGLLAVAAYFIISHFFLQTVKVVGRSMLPTLHDSDHYLLNRWVYYVHSPQRCDVVVLRDPSDNGFSVKRIIAT